MAKANKYGAKKAVVAGIEFDSKAEARRWAELQLLERAGQIANLQRQVEFLLVPTQRRPDGTMERAAKMVVDFVYEQDGRRVCEELKSPATKTPVYNLKRKLLLQVHGIAVKETVR